MWKRYNLIEYSFDYFNCFILAKFLNTAEKLVKYCRDQPVLREVNQSRFLKAKTMMRSYYHVTQALVETGNKEKHARREVVLLAGIYSGGIQDLFSFQLCNIFRCV